MSLLLFAWGSTTPGAGAMPLACLMASQQDATATAPARPPRIAAQLIHDSSSGIKGSSWLNGTGGIGAEAVTTGPASEAVSSPERLLVSEALCSSMQMLCWSDRGSSWAMQAADFAGNLHDLMRADHCKKSTT